MSKQENPEELIKQLEKQINWIPLLVATTAIITTSIIYIKNK